MIDFRNSAPYAYAYACVYITYPPSPTFLPTYLSSFIHLLYHSSIIIGGFDIYIINSTIIISRKRKRKKEKERKRKRELGQIKKTMKNLIIKIFTAVCFVSSLLIMGIGVEQCSILISAVGLGIFSLLIPLSKTDAFEEKNIKKEGR